MFLKYFFHVFNVVALFIFFLQRFVHLWFSGGIIRLHPPIGAIGVRRSTLRNLLHP